MNRLLLHRRAAAILVRDLLVYCLLLLSLAGPVHAAVFERDWKAPGDGLLTFDDVNQRLWLDLSVSQLFRFPEPQLQNAVAEIAPGGLFEGFIWAKRDDVIGLVLSAGIDPTTRDYARNGAPMTQLIDLLSPTVQNFATIRSIGLIDETSHGGSFQVGADIWIRYAPPQAGIEISSLDDFVGRVSRVRL